MVRRCQFLWLIINFDSHKGNDTSVLFQILFVVHIMPNELLYNFWVTKFYIFHSTCGTFDKLVRIIDSLIKHENTSISIATITSLNYRISQNSNALGKYQISKRLRSWYHYISNPSVHLILKMNGATVMMSNSWLIYLSLKLHKVTFKQCIVQDLSYPIYRTPVLDRRLDKRFNLK